MFVNGKRSRFIEIWFTFTDLKSLRSGVFVHPANLLKYSRFFVVFFCVVSDLRFAKRMTVTFESSTNRSPIISPHLHALPYTYMSFFFHFHSKISS
ncbi:hypothetical protein Hdeb2414_s0003g00087891 [Helianthus debilis subsp. tardiflorus]